MKLPQLLGEVNACSLCEGLPLGPKPLLQASASSKILIIGQAPGRAAHESATPWQDRSGDRLRRWLGLDKAQFYDSKLIALIPMGFCYPGKSGTGDMPPRQECAPKWHPLLLDHLKQIELTLLVGRYAINRYFTSKKTLTETVRIAFDEQVTKIALPHPSPRNTAWLKRNPWMSFRHCRIECVRY